jgi:hypothetical protein
VAATPLTHSPRFAALWRVECAWSGLLVVASLEVLPFPGLEIRAVWRWPPCGRVRALTEVDPGPLSHSSLWLAREGAHLAECPTSRPRQGAPDRSHQEPQRRDRGGATRGRATRARELNALRSRALDGPPPAAAPAASRRRTISRASFFASLKAQCAQLPVAAAATTAIIAAIVASKLPRADRITHATPMRTEMTQAMTSLLPFLYRSTGSSFQNMYPRFRDCWTREREGRTRA